jgi:hypothetical protein
MAGGRVAVVVAVVLPITATFPEPEAMEPMAVL